MTGFQSSFLSVSHISHLVITPSFKKVHEGQCHPPFPTVNEEAEGGEGVGASALDGGLSNFLSPLPPSPARSFPPFPFSFPPGSVGAGSDTARDAAFFPVPFPPLATVAVDGVTVAGAGGGVAMRAAVARGLVALTFRTCEGGGAVMAGLVGVDGRILMVWPLLVVMDVVSVDREGTVDTFPPPPLVSLGGVEEGLVGEVEGGLLTAVTVPVNAGGEAMELLTDLHTLSSVGTAVERGRSHPLSTSFRRSSPLSMRLLPTSTLSASSSPTLPALALSLLFLLSPSLSLPSNPPPC